MSKAIYTSQSGRFGKEKLEKLTVNNLIHFYTSLLNFDKKSEFDSYSIDFVEVKEEKEFPLMNHVTIVINFHENRNKLKWNVRYVWSSSMSKERGCASGMGFKALSKEEWEKDYLPLAVEK